MKISYLEDTKLSIKEKGLVILCHHLYKYHKVSPTLANIIPLCTDGEASILSGLKRIKDLGYLEREKTHAHGHFNYSYETNLEREI